MVLDKKNKPKFNVPNLGFFKSVKARWRKPRGTHNKKRMKFQWAGALPKIGYKNHVDNLVVGLEVLAIKRLQQSSVLDNGVAGGSSFINVSGSDRFQVNLLATLLLPLSDSFSVRSYVAVPLRSRTVNVDGLTRSITLSVGMQASI